MSKLVRDKIPEIIKKSGRDPITHIADDEEYWEKLKAKLQEEVDEFFTEPNEEELSDVLEVIKTIADFKGFDTIEETRKKKAEERGSFKGKIILD